MNSRARFLLWGGLAATLMMVRASAGTETERHYLSGRDRAAAVPWDFKCTTADKEGTWTRLPVPSNWEMHGFGQLSYHQDDAGETGFYRHRFSVPKAWRDRRVFIVFEGAMTDAAVAINGRPAGPVHRGGFYPFRHEITALLHWHTENELTVRVDEKSADASVNAAERNGDYWNFGGIFRPVYLEACPHIFLSRAGVDARADGNVRAEIEVDGSSGTETISARIVGPSGEIAARLPPVAVDANGRARLAGRVDQPALWSSESPVLYRFEVELRSAGNALLHTRTARVGFRTFEVRPGDGFYLNGRKLLLKGVNRHSFTPGSGRCLSLDDMAEDVRLIRGMNMNAVRTAHYPPDAAFLDLCDEKGLYVLAELAGWHRSYSAEAGRPLVKAMVRRDENHPSILFWDNGNEGGWNPELDDAFATWDVRRRPVLHPWDVWRGVNTAHYRSYEEVVQMAQGGFVGKIRRLHAVQEPGPHIFFPTEFQHSLFDGGGGAGLEDLWDVIRRGPRTGGGMIWSLFDEGVRHPTTGKMDLRGNEAPDGILGPDRQEEASASVIRELWSPLVAGPRTLGADFRGRLSLENRFTFTNAERCRGHWSLWKMPAADEPGLPRRIDHGSLRLPSIQPGETGTLELPWPGRFSEADVVSVRIEAPDGQELWTWTWALEALDRLRSVPTRAGGGVHSHQPTLERSADAWTVRAGSRTVVFDPGTGQVRRLESGGRTLSLGRGPRLVTGEATLVSLHAEMRGEVAVITARYQGDLESVRWQVRADGWVDCDYGYTASAPASCLGMLFDLPEDQINSKTWCGDGPIPVWQNRRRGTALGVWTVSRNDTVAGWKEWVFPEFKGLFSGVRWLRLQTTSGELSVVVRSRDLFVQILRPSFPPPELARGAAVALPEAALGFHHVIPAMGGKFQAANQLGPQGQIPPLQPRYEGRVSFRFD